MKNIVVYGIDAGGEQNFGWVRLDACPGNIDDYVPIVTPEITLSNNQSIKIDSIINSSDSNGLNFEAGENLATLAARITSDLNNHNRIAIGVESPMWFPISPKGRDYRFDEERNSSWSGQTGSTASVQGMKRALNLFNILRTTVADVGNLSSTTDFNHWYTGKSNIFLFEGFVTGKHKICCLKNPAVRDKTRRPLNPKLKPYTTPYKEEHRWDAFLVASAFYGTFFNCNLGSYQGIQFQLSRYKTNYLDVLSQWHSIMNRLGISIFPFLDEPCNVVAVSN
ncbi:hypothetical protein RAC89_19185 [Paenibacillus sp. GD4]|uniref:hypothetical protein n=1 Tax=Paenibacillus sp. GD4 TaxID=3068890 RepID=UPI002796C324|nr:hypothetical protein [Paenibacillus sp. GD4]MDQ1912521.1 hypothetical protein [Paenibacillus sp. GD4]